MSTATGGLTLFKLRNGATVGASLSVDNILEQIVSLDSNGQVTAIAPDWSVASNQPTITLVAVGNYTFSDLSWYYNGELIIFPNTQFEKSGNSLKIINNLASADNLFTDTISVNAVGMDSSGNFAGNISKSIDVPIRRASSSGYMVLLGTTRTTLTAENPSATITATLLQGATEVSGFTKFLWYKGLSTTPISDTPSKSITINRSDVSGSQTFVARAISESGSELDADGITIYDAADDYDITFTVKMGTETTSNVSKSFNIAADATSSLVTPKLIVNGNEATPSFWKMTKYHQDTVKLIGEIDGDSDRTTDTEDENSYNTNTTGSIIVYDKDYINFASGTEVQTEVGIDVYVEY